MRLIAQEKVVVKSGEKAVLKFSPDSPFRPILLGLTTTCDLDKIGILSIRVAGKDQIVAVSDPLHVSPVVSAFIITSVSMVYDVCLPGKLIEIELLNSSKGTAEIGGYFDGYNLNSQEMPHPFVVEAMKDNELSARLAQIAYFTIMYSGAFTVALGYRLIRLGSRMVRLQSMLNRNRRPEPKPEPKVSEKPQGA